MSTAKAMPLPSTSCERHSVWPNAILEIEETDVTSIRTANGNEEDYVIPDSSDADYSDPRLRYSDDDLEVKEKDTKNLVKVLSLPNELTGKNGFKWQGR